MSAARRKGTSWESQIVAFLRDRGWPMSERRALNGKNDRGDIAGIVGVVIEAKSAARIDLAGWLAEAQQEAINDRADFGVVWAKRKGKSSAADGYVVMDGETFARLLAAGGWQ
jgi:hypothetical protein